MGMLVLVVAGIVICLLAGSVGGAAAQGGIAVIIATAVLVGAISGVFGDHSSE